LVIPGRPERPNPESSYTRFCSCFWIPDSRHGASKTRVNALAAASGMTVENAGATHSNTKMRYAAAEVA